MVERVRPTCILHLAAPVSLSTDKTTRARLRVGIVDATIAIAEAAAAHGVPLVHISSCAVYEGGAAPFSEDQALRPSSPYGQLKLEAEDEVRARMAQGLVATVLRPFRTYGPGCTSGLVAEACRAALRGEPLDLTAGTQVREWNHVKSIASGIIWAAQARPAGAVLNLGGGDRVGVADLAARIFTLAEVPEDRIRRGALPDRAGETTRFWGDHRRTESLRGPLPRVDLDTGLEQTLDWHRTQLRSAR